MYFDPICSLSFPLIPPRPTPIPSSPLNFTFPSLFNNPSSPVWAAYVLAGCGAVCWSMVHLPHVLSHASSAVPMPIIFSCDICSALMSSTSQDCTYDRKYDVCLSESDSFHLVCWTVDPYVSTNGMIWVIFIWERGSLHCFGCSTTNQVWP